MYEPPPPSLGSLFMDLFSGGTRSCCDSGGETETKIDDGFDDEYQRKKEVFRNTHQNRRVDSS